MKKRIRLGPKGEPLFFITGVSILNLLSIVKAIDSKRTTIILDAVFLSVVIFGVLFAIMCFIEDYSYYIKLDKDVFTVRSPLKKICSYRKEEIAIHYAIKMYRFRGIPQLEPCLVIGTFPPNEFLFEEKPRKDVYENYFLIALDGKKKFNKVCAYFNQQIVLPKKEDWEEFKAQWKKRSVRSSPWRVQKYYDLIEQYNQVVNA